MSAPLLTKEICGTAPLELTVPMLAPVVSPGVTTTVSSAAVVFSVRRRCRLGRLRLSMPLITDRYRTASADGTGNGAGRRIDAHRAARAGDNQRVTAGRIAAVDRDLGQAGRRVRVVQANSVLARSGVDRQRRLVAELDGLEVVHADQAVADARRPCS